MSKKRETCWSTAVSSVHTPTRRPKAMTFSASTSLDAGDPAAVTASRISAGGDPVALSTRSHWRFKVGSGSAHRSSSHNNVERDPTWRNECPPSTNTHLWETTTKQLMRSLCKNDLRKTHVIEEMWFVFLHVVSGDDDCFSRANANYTNGNSRTFFFWRWEPS